MKLNVDDRGVAPMDNRSLAGAEHSCRKGDGADSVQKGKDT